MSQYKQSFVFVMDCFPATMKLRDLCVHLGQQKEKQWPLRHIIPQMSVCVLRVGAVQGAKLWGYG